MSLLVIEIVLWVGFGLVLWAMRQSLVQIESDLHSRGGKSAASVRHARRIPPSWPQQLITPIGKYCGQPIHEYAVIDGRNYRFAHICPVGTATCLAHDQRWIAPGLVYAECCPSAAVSAAA